MAEQRRHLAGQGNGRKRPHEGARAIVELRPQPSINGDRDGAQGRCERSSRTVGRRRCPGHAVSIAFADAPCHESTARKLGATGPRAEAYRRIANEIAACRAGVERLLAVVADETPAAKIPEHAGVDASVRALFSDPANPERVRDPEAWAAIIEQSRERFTGAAARELADALDGIEAAKQLGRLAKRVADLVRGRCAAASDCGGLAAGVAVRPGAVPSSRSRQACRIELPRAAVQPRPSLDRAFDCRRSHQAPRAHALAPGRVPVDRGAAGGPVPADAPSCRRRGADRQACRPVARAYRHPMRCS